ncbi:Integrase [uncultured Clostridium sp.]|nr:Integrase [uncultured Clostridium sp.]
MAEKRKDNRGRNLFKGEGQRSDGRYYYQYKNSLNKSKVIYSWTLEELRKREKEIQKDLADSIDETAAKMSLNQLFELYLSLKDKENFQDSTKDDYLGLWNNHIRNTELGNAQIKNIKTSHIKRFYKELKDKGLSNSTIKKFNTILRPSFELALDDDMIRKNPVKKDCVKKYKGEKNVREALTRDEQKKLLDFVESSNVYKIYAPMLRYMLGTGCRIGEVIGITWDDIDMKSRSININHQLKYKKKEDGKTGFMIASPKTDAGKRIIPMTTEVYNALIMQKRYRLFLGTPRDFEVDGYKNFVFVTKNGRPIAPNGFNNAMKNIVSAYNKLEEKKAREEKRKPVLLPHVSAHIFRHTACTRMAEAGMEIKALQYIMGHSNAAVTLDVYTHVHEREIVEEEMTKMEKAM